MAKKKVKKSKSKYSPKRIKEMEEPGRDLIRWYGDSKTGATASFFDEPGNTTMRVCTEKTCKEVGFPFSRLHGQPEDWFRKTAMKWWKRLEKEG